MWEEKGKREYIMGRRKIIRGKKRGIKEATHPHTFSSLIES